MLTYLVVALLLLLAVAATREGVTPPAPGAERLTRALESSWAPWVLGALTTAFYWWLVGEWTPHSRVHDEASYILQAQTFALGRWTNPSPPIPAFFEQYHVFVEPGFFSKYPPGHGLLMVPGIWLGLPALMPMVLHGVAGGLLFVLARRLANPWVALLTWVLWLGVDANIRFRPGYFSEATSSALWLAGWWALLEWRATRRGRWLLLLAACTGWMAITRPLTAVAYALPIAVVAGWDIVRGRYWRDAALAVVVGSAIVAIMPLWSEMSLGQARPTPYALYSDLYFPWDRMGLGLDSTPPRRTLNADMQRFARAMSRQHGTYTAAALPAELGKRTLRVVQESLKPAPAALAVFALVGLVAAGAVGAFALASMATMLLAYLAFAHPHYWTVYYIEIEVVGPYLVALGAWSVVAMVRHRRVRPGYARSVAMPPGSALAGLVMVIPAALLLLSAAPRNRAAHLEAQAYFKSRREAADQMPGPRRIVFVRYAPTHNPHLSLIANDADLASATTWWVYDRGAAENARLLSLAPGRAGFVMDEEALKLGPIAEARPWTPPPDTPAAPR